jgi:DNA repair/transcription protein MET18/MMS19
VHLVALAALIGAMPKAAYVHQLPTVSLPTITHTYIFFISLQLMPLLLRGLSLPDSTLRAGVIDTLLSAAQADIDSGAKTEGNIITEHAVSLTSIMLQNSAASDIADTVSLINLRSWCPFILGKQRVRVGALKYLAVLPKIVQYSVLHPQKATVLRELAKALDDPKRAVRKEAVHARSVALASLVLLAFTLRVRTSWFRYSG